MAKIVPIFKNGDRSSLDNYRPISILPAASKVLETIVNSQLTEFLEHHSFLLDRQFGFRKGHSAEMLLLDTLDAWRRELDDKKAVGVVFLDLKKAFDSVSHSLLIAKLPTFALSQASINWFGSYLSGRHQFVQYQNETSSVEHITRGVPQGSLLGPLIFSLFINDLLQVLSAQTNLFADDGAMHESGPDLAEVRNSLNMNMKALGIWLEDNELQLNAKKTRVMYRVAAPPNAEMIKSWVYSFVELH